MDSIIANVREWCKVKGRMDLLDYMIDRTRRKLFSALGPSYLQIDEFSSPHSFEVKESDALFATLNFVESNYVKMLISTDFPFLGRYEKLRGYMYSYYENEPFYELSVLPQLSVVARGSKIRDLDILSVQQIQCRKRRIIGMRQKIDGRGMCLVSFPGGYALMGDIWIVVYSTVIQYVERFENSLFVVSPFEFPCPFSFELYTFQTHRFVPYDVEKARLFSHGVMLLMDGIEYRVKANPTIEMSVKDGMCEGKQVYCDRESPIDDGIYEICYTHNELYAMRFRPTKIAQHLSSLFRLLDYSNLPSVRDTGIVRRSSDDSLVSTHVISQMAMTPSAGMGAFSLMFKDGSVLDNFYRVMYQNVEYLAYLLNAKSLPVNTIVVVEDSAPFRVLSEFVSPIAITLGSVKSIVRDLDLSYPDAISGVCPTIVSRMSMVCCVVSVRPYTILKPRRTLKSIKVPSLRVAVSSFLSDDYIPVTEVVTRDDMRFMPAKFLDASINLTPFLSVFPRVYDRGRMLEYFDREIDRATGRVEFRLSYPEGFLSFLVGSCRREGVDCFFPVRTADDYRLGDSLSITSTVGESSPNSSNEFDLNSQDSLRGRFSRGKRG